MVIKEFFYINFEKNSKFRLSVFLVLFWHGDNRFMKLKLPGLLYYKEKLSMYDNVISGSPEDKSFLFPFFVTFLQASEDKKEGKGKS